MSRYPSPINCLAGLTWHVSPQDWAILGSLGVPVRFARRQVLFRQGEPPGYVYVLLEGVVKVVRSESDGGLAILTIRSAGDVVGDMAAMDGRPRSATVATLSPLVAQLLTAQQFRSFVARPTVSTGFARYVVARLREADEQRVELALLPVRVRLARTLARLARPSQLHDGSHTVRLSQQDLAQLVGASRNAVVAELSTLRAMGVLSTGRCLVVIHNPTLLTRLGEA